MFQLLLALKACGHARIIHRDIKPANVLLKEDCTLKLADMGLSRTMDEEKDAEEEDEPMGGGGAAGGGGGGGGSSTAQYSSGSSGGGSTSSGAAATSAPFTKHVQTRWYRAPELPLYNNGKYTAAIDMWSVGCCMAELLTRRELALGKVPGPFKEGDLVLFPSGSCVGLENTSRPKVKKDLLHVVFEVLGRPTPESIGRLKTEGAKELVRATLARMDEMDQKAAGGGRAGGGGAAAAPAPPARPTLKERWPNASSHAVDLISRMLDLHEDSRITPSAAMEHPYFADLLKSQPLLRAQKDEALLGSPVCFGSIELDNEKIRALLVEEIRVWNPQIPAEWRGRAIARGGGGT